MTLEGAINFSENDNSTIYTMNSNQTGQYCVVVPKNTDLELSMLVDINMKSLFDSLMANTITKEQLVEKINEEYKYVSTSYAGGILVLPMLDINLLTNAVNNNDKQKMFDETKKIGAITSEIYKKLNDAGIEKSRINQKIMIIEKTDNDIKFVEWLKTQMPNFVDGLKLDDLKSKLNETVNPFANVNPFIGDTSDESKPQNSAVNDVFGTPQSSVVDRPMENNVQSNDIFSNSNETVNQTLQTPENDQQAINPQPIQSVNISEPQSEDTLENQKVVTPSPIPESVANELEGDSNDSNIDKKSGGFANLLILLVILIGVTVASIELGKFLYSTFGA